MMLSFLLSGCEVNVVGTVTSTVTVRDGRSVGRNGQPYSSLNAVAILRVSTFRRATSAPCKIITMEFGCNFRYHARRKTS